MDNSPPQPSHDYRYAAFISYRHVEPDRRWAKWLHSALETYRIPKRIGSTRKIGRVFRDEEELPASADLSQEINRALEASRFLIVICSPRTLESKWVNKEVERFRELGRHDRILALLIEGEPGEAFPIALREIRRTLVDDQGISSEKIEEVEPLAADVRLSRDETQRHLKRMAKLRVLACILGVRFDDLRQRDQERRIRFMAAATFAMTLILIVLTTLTLFAARQQSVAQAAQRKTAGALVEVSRQRDESERQGYFAAIAAATSALEHNQVVLAREYLLNTAPNLRNWEWGYLNAECDTSIGVLRGHDGAILSAAFNSDGSRIVSGSEDQTARVWDSGTGKVLMILRGHKVAVCSAAFSSDGKRIVTASRDRTAKIWDASSGRVIITLSGHDGGVNRATFSADGKWVTTSSSDKTARVWDADSGREIVILHDDDEVCSAELSLDGKRVVTASESGFAKIWDVSTGQTITTFNGHDDVVTFAAYSTDDSLVVTTSADGTARVWNPSDGRELAVFRGHDEMAQVNSAQFSKTGSQIVSASSDNTARVWDPASGEEAEVFRGHEGSVTFAAFSPDGTRIVTASVDHTLRVWSPTPQTNTSPAWKWDIEKKKYQSLIANLGQSKADLPKPGMEITILPNNTAEVSDQLGRRTLLRGHLGAINVAGFSPDLKRVVTGSSDKTLRVWDSVGGRQLVVLRGHAGSVEEATFSSDGTIIASGSTDTTIRLWDSVPAAERYMATGQPLVPRFVPATQPAAATTQPAGN